MATEKLAASCSGEYTKVKSACEVVNTCSSCTAGKLAGGQLVLPHMHYCATSTLQD